MSPKGRLPGSQLALSVEDEASELFIQRLYGEWTAEDQAAFAARLERDSAFAEAWERVEEGWASLDRHAEAPEVMTWRADALAKVRRANARRWLKPSGPARWRIAAAVAALSVALGTAWQLSPHGYHPDQYRTAIGEQRLIELEDRSRITMDAATRLAVRFSNESRTVRLLEGQAQFSVAKDPSRPFKVLAGDRAVIAVGTVFTVEYAGRTIHVTMLEGKVAVLTPNLPRPEASSRSEATTPLPGQEREESAQRKGEVRQRPEPGGSDEIYLTAGEELRVADNGQAIVTPKADLEAATAWREGKVIFRAETLGEAVRRMNRYSRLQVRIDDTSLASRHISGVFEAGDTRGFVDALQRYLPVTADYADEDTVRLEAR